MGAGTPETARLLQNRRKSGTIDSSVQAKAKSCALADEQMIRVSRRFRATASEDMFKVEQVWATCNASV
jgi:hypothetical protein